jgi:hypothetical protein
MLEHSYIERLERKFGYQEGFMDGLEAYKHCRDCDIVLGCDPSSYKVSEHCPYSKIKNEIAI